MLNIDVNHRIKYIDAMRGFVTRGIFSYTLLWLCKLF